MSKIKGTVVFDGAAAEPKGFETDTDVDFNSNEDGVLQSLRVGEKNYTIPQGGGGGTKFYKHEITYSTPVGNWKIVVCTTWENNLGTESVGFIGNVPLMFAYVYDFDESSPYYIYYIESIEKTSTKNLKISCYRRDLSDTYSNFSRTTLVIYAYNDDLVDTVTEI